MNREILFRGKRLDDVEWIEGNYCYDVNNNEIEVPCIQIKPGAKYEVDFETVGQYTDLFDKNWKKVFDGDIVKDAHGFNKIVSFRNSAFVLIDHDVFYYLHEYIKTPIALTLDLEVIGNIHDNPELLEGK